MQQVGSKPPRQSGIIQGEPRMPFQFPVTFFKPKNAVSLTFYLPLRLRIRIAFTVRVPNYPLSRNQTIEAKCHSESSPAGLSAVCGLWFGGLVVWLCGLWWW
ncbi:uncharacterized protein BO95DRAFT_442055 [Aspergillus brunneoviolaceus CBS 621.78]|uniref:Uncharacterized protein n=1 Tax=Aspergillus brunneoviolaceus CBS 621.78 TaxID=1450534 RepID=A0ACD1GBI6_9EURO|nr:hypothetical protein BO95DRAFT_442055 [Aspergillus brunneoviolaceus CBS 621.78]RAH46537.1 hypothetical protein BO95DRAFT_442055 [Aspergillus brunneoviolaceus CBS 621.78]